MKKGCFNCRYWSELVAQCIEGGPLEALCLSQNSPHLQTMTQEKDYCNCWKENIYGAIDLPGNAQLYQEIDKAF